jgi:hypothetical protein
MTSERTPDWGPPLNTYDPARYRICAQGRFSPSWLDMLSGEWAIAEPAAGRPGATILVGQVLDQAALIGVLEQLYSLGLPLLSIEHLAPPTRAAVANSIR